MKKIAAKTPEREKELRSEYDFSSMTGGVRGKYYKAYRSGHKVEIHQVDGSATVRYFKLEEGAVMLAPDVKKYFPNSEAVNKALRTLIGIIPLKRRITVHPK